MQENKNPTPEQQTQKPSLWRRCQQKIKGWRWELEEHPGRFSLDIQGAVARLAARLRTLRAKAKQLSYAKKAHQFPESDHPAAQLFLLGIGSLPRLGSALREKWMHRRKFRIHLSARLQARVDKLRLHPAVFLGSAVAVAAVAIVLSLYTVGTSVSYDGVDIGTVSGRSVVRRSVSQLESVTRQTVGDAAYTLDTSRLQTKTRVVPRKQLTSRADFLDHLTDQVGLVDEGYALYVDGELTAATTFSGALEELLQQLKNGYVTANTVDCYFKEQIEIRHEYVKKEYMMNLGYIAELLNDTKQGEEIYTVQAGDVWGQIANDHGMLINELLALNPGYDVDRIHVGDQLTISNAVPYLTVVDVERQSGVQDIPYEVEYQDDSSLYVGDTRVLSAGVYGKADVTANVTYINGEETNREVVASVTLSEPVAELQARGTMERPTWLPTGSFRWPCSGRISSRFGYRNTGIAGASTYHKGIDISNSYGTPILAADGGTVTYAGWMSGYGYLIIIDHGNGYETYYGHNSSLVASVGEKVYKGQQVARMGSTGISSGNHCHFGVKKNGTFVNPLNYLP